ncbi:hypothetical protein C8R44DRAFT_881783 [Mycena epipterygia]|nr:hypothetical protein C8R44DRAFT_881783 [Mycena epipterygia]
MYRKLRKEILKKGKATSGPSYPSTPLPASALAFRPTSFHCPLPALPLRARSTLCAFSPHLSPVSFYLPAKALAPRSPFYLSMSQFLTLPLRTLSFHSLSPPSYFLSFLHLQFTSPRLIPIRIIAGPC